jgi:hypothetical protein
MIYDDRTCDKIYYDSEVGSESTPTLQFPEYPSMFLDYYPELVTFTGRRILEISP